MSLEYIVAGDYGQVVVLTVIDIDTNAAANLSLYTDSIEIQLKDPDGNVSLVTAAFVTDGSDGLVSYQLQDGDIDVSGLWNIRTVATSPSAVLRSLWEPFNVHA